MTDNFNEESEAPPVMIQWSGSISDIPSGWALCDGNNGTPNLLNRFVKGTSSASENPGSTGGSDTYTISVAQLPSHDHNGSTSSDGDHNHAVESEERQEASWANDLDAGGPYSGITSYTTYNGNHGHTFSTYNAGSGSSVDSRPSFYEVAFIKKL